MEGLVSSLQYASFPPNKCNGRRNKMASIKVSKQIIPSDHVRALIYTRWDALYDILNILEYNIVNVQHTTYLLHTRRAAYFSDTGDSQLFQSKYKSDQYYYINKTVKVNVIWLNNFPSHSNFSYICVCYRCLFSDEMKKPVINSDDRTWTFVPKLKCHLLAHCTVNTS